MLRNIKKLGEHVSNIKNPIEPMFDRSWSDIFKSPSFIQEKVESYGG
jgi:hypothetical protein